MNKFICLPSEGSVRIVSINDVKMVEPFTDGKSRVFLHSGPSFVCDIEPKKVWAKIPDMYRAVDRRTGRMRTGNVDI